jgi:hypothetical protein
LRRPSANQRATGAPDQSSTSVNGVSQEISSRAWSAQNPVRSAAAHEYSSGCALAWAANAGSGAKRRSSVRRFSRLGDVVDSSVTVPPVRIGAAA